MCMLSVVNVKTSTKYMFHITQMKKKYSTCFVVFMFSQTCVSGVAILCNINQWIIVKPSSSLTIPLSDVSKFPV